MTTKRQFVVLPGSVALVATRLRSLASAGPDAYGPYPHMRGPMQYQYLDRNGDGTVTPDEMATARTDRHAARAQAGYRQRHAGQAPRFEQLDTDNHGSISRAEFEQYQAAMMGRRGRGPGADRGWGPGRGPGWGPGRGPGWGNGRGGCWNR